MLRAEPGVQGEPEPILPLMPFGLYPDQSFLALAIGDPVRATIVRSDFESGPLEVLGVLQEHKPGFGQITVGNKTLSADLLPTPPLFAVSQRGTLVAVARVAAAAPMESPTENLSDGIVSVAIALFTPRGDTIYNSTIELAGDRISKTAVDSIMTRRVRDMSASEVASYRARVNVPDFWPPVVRIVVGDDGVVWLQLRSSHQLSPYLNLDRQGNPKGILMLPARTSIAAAHGLSIWCLESDSNDVQSVVRYTVQ
jgi:hypothetical protein